MSAYVRALNVLVENVRAEVKQAFIGIAAQDRPAADKALNRLLSQLDADAREVRADVDALIDGGEW